jgi:hypothetical protein
MHGLIRLKLTSQNARTYVGVGASLQINVLNRGGSRSCVGDTVNYTCTIARPFHTWSVVPPNTKGIGFLLGGSFRRFNLTGGMIFVAAHDRVNDVISTVLTVTSYDGFDGSDITCRDPYVRGEGGDVQRTIAAVFGE